ncbi:GtrA family protein [Pontiella sulfatireligans]|uniref:GtrA family protein n=1 Tax=Pontiella sulfatireligans TaxID=2750658 RepID=UPI0038B6ACB2
MFRFLLTGGWNTIFSYALFSGLYFAFSEKVHYMVILTVSTVLGVTNAYVCHKFFVFRTKGNYLREYLRFYAVYSVQIVINYISLPLLMKSGMSPYLAQGLIVGITTAGTYLGHKHISFASPKRQL